MCGDAWSTRLQEVCNHMHDLLAPWARISVGTELSRDCELFGRALVHSMSVAMCLMDPQAYPRNISEEQLETCLFQV